jgi:hypothetical protein
MAGALFASAELWVSQVAPAAALFTSMLGIHALTGLAEGAITAACLTAIERLNPEFVYAGIGPSQPATARTETGRPQTRGVAASGR